MKIKVCHFANIITGKSDGVYAHLMMLFKNLDKEKFQQYLVFQGNPDIESQLRKIGVEVCVIKSLNKKFSLRAFIDFYSFIKSQGIDIIQVHFLKPYAIAGISNILLRKKMIFNYHGLFINNIYYNGIDKFFYKIAHSIIHIFSSVNLAVAPSNISKKLLYDETKYFPEIRIYYNGYNQAVIENLNTNLVNYFKELKKTYFIVGIVARIEVQKRIDISLNIAKRLFQKSQDIFFLFLGDGPLESQMKSLAHSLGLDENINFMGFIPDAKLYMKYFDVVLLTSDWEGLPFVVWEAMSAGVPIVSTDVGGIREIIIKENCGFVYEQNNLSDAVDKINCIFKDNSLKNQMGNNGKIAIQNKFNNKIFSEFFNNLYSELYIKS
jgi:glycosyltransferase involved in cell wall biosynthesis